MPQPRRPQNLVITIPPVERAHSLPLRYSRTNSLTPWSPVRRLACFFSWAVATTFVLWIFVLHSDYAYAALMRISADAYRDPLTMYRMQAGSQLSAHRTQVVKDLFEREYRLQRSRQSSRMNASSASVINALDTMYLMGLSNLFEESLEEVAQPSSFTNLSLSADNVLEISSAQLGGLLSAYSLSREPVAIVRADELGRLLLPTVEMLAKQTVATGQDSPSTLGTLDSLHEFTVLAHLTGRKEYFLRRPEMPSSPNGSQQSISSEAEQVRGSFQEYYAAAAAYLKEWLLTNKTDDMAVELYKQTVNGLVTNLLFLTRNRKLLYVTEIERGAPSHRFPQSACSLPSLLVLGVDSLGIKLPLADREVHSWAARGLAHTCWVLHADQKSRLAPEEVEMEPWLSPDDSSLFGNWMYHVQVWRGKGKSGNGPPGTEETYVQEMDPLRREYAVTKDRYALWPEAVECFLTLWTMTGSESWRHRGWEIFESTLIYSPFGYNVDAYPRTYSTSDSIVTYTDDQVLASAFFSKTLKYYYLLFSEEVALSSHSWIFNSAGHPLPISSWRHWEANALKL